MKQLRTILLLTLASIIIMFAIPFIGVKTIPGDAGMAFMFLLFYIVDPVFAICTGIISGKSIKKLWLFPLIPAVTFVLSHWVLFSMGEGAFVWYGGIYLLLGTAAMLVTGLIIKVKRRV